LVFPFDGNLTGNFFDLTLETAFLLQEVRRNQMVEVKFP